MSKLVKESSLEKILTKLHAYLSDKLSDNNFTDELKGKLDGIESGAQVNVTPNWDAQPTESGYINNKPTLGSAASKDVSEFDIEEQSEDTGLVSAKQVASFVHDELEGLQALQFAGVVDRLPGESDIDAIERTFPNPEKGWLVIMSDNSKEYICTENGSSEGAEWRQLGDETAFVSKTTQIAGIPINNGITAEELSEALEVSGSVQSDWNVNDETSAAFIKNKPTIPTLTSQLTNDSTYQTSSDVDSTVDNKLSNYTTTEGLTALLAEKVDTSDYTTTISGINSSIGSLNSSITSLQSDVAGKQDKLTDVQVSAVNSGITSDKISGYDSHIADTDVHVSSDEKTSWNSKADTSYVDTAVSVKQDKLTEDQISAVNSGITSSKISSYDSHISDTTVHVTAAEKTDWNSKADTSYVDTAVSSKADASTVTQLSSTVSGISTTIEGYGDIVTHNSSEFVDTNTLINYSTTDQVQALITESANTKQDKLTTSQISAVNSGITSTKVSGYDSHIENTDVHVTDDEKTEWNSKASQSDFEELSGEVDKKQDKLTTSQLSAANSGITSDKVSGYDSHIADTDIHVSSDEKSAWNGKADTSVVAEISGKVDAINSTLDTYGDIVTHNASEFVDTTTLSNYSTTAEVESKIDTKLADYSTTAEVESKIDTKLADYSTTTEVNGLIETAVSGLASSSDLTAEATARETADTTLQGNIDSINNKISSKASETDKLLSSTEIDEKIQSMSAEYISSNAQMSTSFEHYSSMYAQPIKATNLEGGKWYKGGVECGTNDTYVTKNDIAIVREDESMFYFIAHSFTYQRQKVGVVGVYGSIKTPNGIKNLELANHPITGETCIWCVDDSGAFYPDNKVVYICKAAAQYTKTNAIEEYVTENGTLSECTDETLVAYYDLMFPTTRYSCSSSQTDESDPVWGFQYIVNSESLSSSQLAALNSGITSNKVTSYDSHVADTSIHLSKDVDDLTNYTKTSDLSAVATDNSYESLDDKPSISEAETGTYYPVISSSTSVDSISELNTYGNKVSIIGGDSGISVKVGNDTTPGNLIIAGQNGNLATISYKNDSAALDLDVSTLATKSEVEAKQNTLTSGNGISIESDTISASLSAGSNIEITEDSTIEIAVSEDLSVTTITVNSSAVLNDTLSVAGDSSFTKIDVSDDASFSSAVSVEGATELNGGLYVTSSSSGSVFSVDGESELNGDVLISETLTVTKEISTNSSISADGDLSVGGNSNITGTETVTGAITAGCTISAVGAISTEDNLTVDKDATITGQLSFGTIDAANMTSDVDLEEIMTDLTENYIPTETYA